jgi:DNA-binding Lrp family transcriptional regulator
MVEGILLVNAVRGQVNTVAEALIEVPGITRVYSVGGRFDLVAQIRVRTNEELAEIVTRRLASLETIEKTETLVAFEVYSRKDVEAAFSLGMEQA